MPESSATQFFSTSNIVSITAFT